MTLGSIRAGDLVAVDKKGRRFLAVATERAAGGELRIRPLDRALTWRVATAREVVGHWKPTAATADLAAALAGGRL